MAEPSGTRPETVPTEPAPDDLLELQRRRRLAAVELHRVHRAAAKGTPVPRPDRIKAQLGVLMAQLNLFRPLRAWQVYTLRHGPLMAAGSSYTMFFSIAALLVAGFSIFALVAGGNTALQDVVVRVVNQSTPGLINMGDGRGLATPEELFSHSGGFSLSLVISTITLLVTSLGWIAGLREGVRGVFGAGALQTNGVLLKLKDLATLLLLGVALVVTSVLSVGTATALDWLRQTLNLSQIMEPLTFIAALVVMLALDVAVSAVLFRFAAAVTMPRKVLWQTVLLAAIGSTLLRSLSSLLLANVAGRNPLLAPFSVILGLFVWFYLLSQVYLLATGWAAVGTADVATRAREKARREAELERYSGRVDAARPGVLGRLRGLFRRHRPS
ncbi:YihY/virulence factor BrkB family protein [Psychromicrobium xiongbiense]|uniref:YihY/virulence factor BrkB family protein n=1 Tax=Psychromicrobium xiongbiense TaxID=3051184 RepID=UPI0025566877|nr:YihY/virulence factor BrkB family protein [Psychromicrobium sp. YIM S02556]